MLKRMFVVAALLAVVFSLLSGGGAWSADPVPGKSGEKGWYQCTGFPEPKQSPYLDNQENQDPDNTRANKAPTFEAVDRVLSLRRPMSKEVTVIPGRIHKSALKFKKGDGFNFGVAAYDREAKRIYQGTGVVGMPDGDPETVPVTYTFENRIPQNAAAIASGHCEKYWSKELYLYNIRTGMPWKACWGVASRDPDHVERIAYQSAAGNIVGNIPGAKNITLSECDELMKSQDFRLVKSQGALYYVNPGVSLEDFADARCTSPDKYWWQRYFLRNGGPMAVFPMTPLGMLASNGISLFDAYVNFSNNFPKREKAAYVAIGAAEKEARSGGLNTGYLTVSSAATPSQYLTGTATRTHLDPIFFYGREKGRLENYMGASANQISIRDGKTTVRGYGDFCNMGYRPLSITGDNWGVWLGGCGRESNWWSRANPWNSSDHGNNLGGGGSLKAVYLGENGYGGEVLLEGGFIRQRQTCSPQNRNGGFGHFYGQVWFPGIKFSENVSVFDAIDADAYIGPGEWNVAARVRPLHITAFRRDLVNLRAGVAINHFRGIGNLVGPVASLGLFDDSVIPFGFLNPDGLISGGVAVSPIKFARWANRASVFSNTFEVDWKTHGRILVKKSGTGFGSGRGLAEAARENAQ